MTFPAETRSPEFPFGPGFVGKWVTVNKAQPTLEAMVVPGGTLVRTIAHVGPGNQGAPNVALCFIPNPPAAK